jgi:uncharacterized membrane protein YkvA (DUF1232 family)
MDEQAAKPLNISEVDFKKILWPIFKRVPRYLRLALAFAGEPEIPARYKTILYGAVIYQVTPIHFLFAPIPVVGQIDTIILLGLGIRQAYDHCPPDIANHHFAKLGLRRNQLDRDMAVVLGFGDYTVTTAARRVSRDARYAGRIAAGVGKRQLSRLLAEKD